MIYDCFTFFNELDLLEVRLNVLDGVVDKFVLVEATKTHSNSPKELFYQKNAKRYEKFKDKIIHIVVDDYPPFESAWTYETHQRNCISRALVNCKDDDVIIISDLDEIPNPAAILKNKDKPGIKSFKQDIFYYFFNGFIYHDWKMSRMLFYKDFKSALNDYNKYGEYLPEANNKGTTASKIRLYSGKHLQPVKNGGWHFSYLFDPENISQKLKAFGHQEFNTADFTDVEKIKERIAKGENLFNRKAHKLIKVRISPKEYPPFICENQERFAQYIAKYDGNRSIARARFISRMRPSNILKVVTETIKKPLRSIFRKK